ncbi:MAG: hypothetical protein LBR89_04920, partial [Holosporales bacterium]|nr:hypothetical protein [Holosporales bacterium]
MLKKCWYLGLLTCATTCVSFASTATRTKQSKQETSHLSLGENWRHEVERARSLYQYFRDLDTQELLYSDHEAYMSFVQATMNAARILCNLLKMNYDSVPKGANSKLWNIILSALCDLFRLESDCRGFTGSIGDLYIDALLNRFLRNTEDTHERFAKVVILLVLGANPDDSALADLHEQMTAIGTRIHRLFVELEKLHFFDPIGGADGTDVRRPGGDREPVGWQRGREDGKIAQGGRGRGRAQGDGDLFEEELLPEDDGDGLDDDDVEESPHAGRQQGCRNQPPRQGAGMPPNGDEYWLDDDDVGESPHAGRQQGCRNQPPRQGAGMPPNGDEYWLDDDD